MQTPGSQHVSSKLHGGLKLSQAPAAQTPRAQSTRLAHQSPSVSRLHIPVWGDRDEPHAPELHVYVVTDRVRVPLSSHSSLKPLQVDHAPYRGDPHDRPSVSRGQALVSVAVDVTHVPEPQS
jgi:hypothetical protein